MTSPTDNATDWTPPKTYELLTSDGRTIHYSTYGPEEGNPLVAHSGTPGTRLLSAKGEELMHRAGVRVLVADRPGYGGSTRRRGRSVADVAADTALLADAQGWDRFATWGGSGGGPHALACAALLPDRITRCAAVVSPAPYDGADLDWLAGMSAGNVEEFTRALEGEASYRPLVEELSAQALAQIAAGDPAIPPGYDLPETDLAEIGKRAAEKAGGWVEVNTAMWSGVDGWIDDCLAMVGPWGFSVSDLTGPVSIWYGPDDVLVPRAHADWLLAHVPGAEGRELAGGHMLTEDDLLDVVRWATQIT